MRHDQSAPSQPLKATGAMALFPICDSSIACEDYNTYRAHPWSPFPLRRALFRRRKVSVRKRDQTTSRTSRVRIKILIGPTLGALFPLGEPILDPVLTVCGHQRIDLNSDIDIKILFSKVDSPENQQLWTYHKKKTRQKWHAFKENPL